MPRSRIIARLAGALTTAALTLTLAASARAIPAFPGAEGFGAVATGGRGGQVLKVTTLDAAGPGSLQAALDTPGPRIIVFEVSGVIEVDSLLIPHGDVTIAGQTAPGAGVTILGRLYAAYDYGVTNIIIRHVRVRPPQCNGCDGNQYDGIQLSRQSRVILDHVSVAYGVDETVDLYEAEDVTVQWSLIGESQTMGHPEGEHNYGLINGPDGLHSSIHHNLFAHHKNRCPAVANGPCEVINNVDYDVRNGFVHHNPSSGPFNIVGNFYKRGASDELFPFFFDDAAGPMLSYYLADNYIDDPGVFVGVVDNPWTEPWAHPSFEYLDKPESYRADALHDFSGVVGWEPVTTHGSEEAYDVVLARAGAFPRDALDLRMLDETQSRTGSWGAAFLADPLEGLTPGAPPDDDDDDGMPNAWELDHGLDPDDGTDHATVTPSGYTAIEDYINCLADQLVGLDVACAGEEPGDTDSDTGTGSSTTDDGGSTSGPNTTSDSDGGASTTEATIDPETVSGPGNTSEDPSAGPGDTSGGPTGGSETSADSDGADDGGCGCASAPDDAPAASALAALCLLTLRRRRR